MTLNKCWFKAPLPPHQMTTSRLPDHANKMSPSETIYSSGILIDTLSVPSVTPLFNSLILIAGKYSSVSVGYFCNANPFKKVISLSKGDYETYGSAIPAFDGFRPYQQIPFQYALFIQESKKSKLKFVEFLAREFKNPIPQFLAHMREHVGPVGSVVVWNAGFESGRNVEMAEQMPEYKDFLLGMNERMFDLMLIFKFRRKLYTHSGFKQSASLKMVLPVICPDLSYDSLAIHEGGTASASWPVLTDKDTPELSKQKLANDMLEYCKRDSEAMVKILEHVEKKIFSGKAKIRRLDQLPAELEQFIEHSRWTFAVTYAKTWPHEYIVQEHVDNVLFLALAHHIDTFGYESHFYKTKQVYFDYNGYTYWHMEDIINRCPEADTYHRREKEGRLPRND